MLKISTSVANLVTILELIGRGNLHWSLRHVWVTSKRGSNVNVFELEEKTRGEFGYQLDWDSLMSLANQLEQVTDCTLIGVESTELLPNRSIPVEDLREVCDVIIESVDSTYWEVHLKDKVLFRKLAERFSS